VSAAPAEREGEIPVPGFDAARMEHYERGTAHRGPRELLVRALAIVGEPAGPGAAPRRAIDLGAGLGQEAEELLRRGWCVTATDASRRMLDSVRRRASAIGAGDRLEVMHAAFEATPIAPESFDLVHAGFALPFCPPRHFDAVWRALRASLRPGGLFVGQFFGPRDEFVITSPAEVMSSHTTDEVRARLDGMEVLVHEEVDRMGETAPGVPKHWHVHHVIARKRASEP